MNYIYDEDILLDISSRLSRIINEIKNGLEDEDSDKITERTIINFCKNLYYDEKNPLNIKNNFLYFYFPSLIGKEKEKCINIINNNIIKKGLNFNPIAKSYSI